MAEPTFIKLGVALINPSHIASVMLHYEDPIEEISNAVLISLANGNDLCYFNEEAEILRRYFLHGSRAVDLNNLYWTEKP